jgi:hypothetical protein
VLLPIQKSAAKTMSLPIQKSAVITASLPIQKSAVTTNFEFSSKTYVCVDSEIGSDGGVVFFFWCLHSPSFNMNFNLEI